MKERGKLTPEEAIKYFERHLELYCVEGVSREAEKMAIKALKPRTGHWIMHDRHRECSECGVWLLKDMPRNSYCPNCGCRMESEVQDADND